MRQVADSEAYASTVETSKSNELMGGSCCRKASNRSEDSWLSLDYQFIMAERMIYFSEGEAETGGYKGEAGLYETIGG